MTIGDEVMLTDTVLLANADGCQVLTKGNIGVVHWQSGSTVDLLCDGMVYTDVPLFALEPVHGRDSSKRQTP